MSETDHNRKSPPDEEREAPSPLARLLDVLAFIGSLPDELWRRIRRIGPRVRSLRREHRAGNFPESDRFPIRLVLLLAAQVSELLGPL